MQRREVAAVACLDLLLDVAQAAQLPARDPADDQGQHRQDEQQQQYQAGEGVAAGFAPLFLRVGQLQPQLLGRIVERENAVVGRVAEAFGQLGCPAGFGRGLGAHQHAAVQVAQLQQQGRIVDRVRRFMHHGRHGIARGRDVHG
ncbi:hypothetical protein D3C78_1509440 [compost metagenome]